MKIYRKLFPAEVLRCARFLKYSAGLGFHRAGVRYIHALRRGLTGFSPKVNVNTTVINMVLNVNKSH